MRQLRLVALHVESSAGESESFGLMLCGISVSQERPSGSGPEEVGSRLCFCLFCGGGGWGGSNSVDISPTPLSGFPFFYL